MNAPNASRKQKVYFLNQDWDQSLFKVLTLIMTLRKLCEDVGQVCISGS